MRPRGRWAGAVFGCLLLLAGTAAGSEEDEDVVVLKECKDRWAFVLGVEEAVRTRVPARYELVRDPVTGRPLVWVDAGLHCESYTVIGESSATTIAVVAALIESPHGEGCLSAMPGLRNLEADALPVCNAYLLWDATDNARYAEFLRSGTPDFPIWTTDELSFEQGSFDPFLLGAPFHFRAGPSAPFRLTSDFVVRERPGGPAPVAVFFWTETVDGTVKLSIYIDDLEFGEASGTVRTEPGSELAEIFGGERGTPAPGLALFGAARWSRAMLTKTVIH